MANLEYIDAIVVGAGVIGSSTVYHLVKNGQKTLLIEQVIKSYGTFGKAMKKYHGAPDLDISDSAGCWFPPLAITYLAH